MVHEDLISEIYNLSPPKMIQHLIIFNKNSFFNVIGTSYIRRLEKESWKGMENFDLVNDLHLKRLVKKDSLFVQKLFDQEINSFVLFYENYLVFDLPVTIENIEHFKRDKHPKIYRYKREIEINGEIYTVEELLKSSKKKFIQKEYRIEFDLLSNK